MIALDIPGRGQLQLEHLVLDVNGTLAVDGNLMEGVASKLVMLRKVLAIHLITADTHGRQAAIDQQLDLEAVRIKPGDEAGQKAAYVRQLGAENVVAIGQGANDALMLKEAALGICVLSDEGTASEALTAADLVIADIMKAFELLEKPARLAATLRK
ncbi:MAG: ATPase P [Anaerolineaceae bacterium]